MKYLVLCFNFLVVINTVYSALTVDAPTRIKLDKSTENLLLLKCNISTTATDLTKVKVEWKKDSVLIGEIAALKDRATAIGLDSVYSLEIKRPTTNDVGNYSCLVNDGSDEREKTIQVAGAIYLKVAENINVVEGEKLRIHCQIAGKPAPPLVWSFTPDREENNTEVDISNGGRYSLEEDEHKHPNSILIVKDITMEDRGHFNCISQNNRTLKVSSMVRVKDKYAALWPFLGIVAEVVILCAIIFIYEKKHNKTELDESDTDQSPDQKNTPDQGKDGLRHRQ